MEGPVDAEEIDNDPRVPLKQHLSPQNINEIIPAGSLLVILLQQREEEGGRGRIFPGLTSLYCG